MKVARVGLIIIVILLATKVHSFDKFQSGFVTPVEAKYLSQKQNFAVADKDYFAGYWHCGVDIICPLYTSVYAVADGIVTLCSPSGWDDNGEKSNYAMMIKHKTSLGLVFYAIYGHMLRPVKNSQPLSDDEIRKFRVGDKVAIGEEIGKIGKWNPPHLHLGLWHNPQSPDNFPTTNLGRASLPKPEETKYIGITSCGNWRQSIEWLDRLRPGVFNKESILVGDFCPLQSIDQKTIYFIRANDGISLLMAFEIESKKISQLWKLDQGQVVESI